jgi:Flp pilus assembly protein TadD
VQIATIAARTDIILRSRKKGLVVDTMVLNETFESRELFLKAEGSIKRCNYQEASILLNEALKISPNNPIYLSSMGLCLSMMGNSAAGEKMCRQAMTQAKEKAPALYVNLGKVLLERGKRQEAREAFTRAYRMDNTNARAALELSRMGVRKKPVIPFLSRNARINIWLGKLRHRIIEKKQQPKLKKL